MVIIDWKSLSGVAQEYVDRLISWAKYPRRKSFFSDVVNKIGVPAFRGLILCSPQRLKNYSCPANLDTDKVYEAYDAFFQSRGADKENNAIWLMHRLNIKVCPYCNRIYTFSLNSKNKIRPQFDHFFPRSDSLYKHLAISFYNLIPSCPACNGRKSTEIYDFHPYYGSLIKGCQTPKIHVVDNKVVYDKNGQPILFPEKPEIKIDNPNKNTNHLALGELYKHHSDYAKEILDKIIAYNASYFDPLIKEFQGMGRTPEEIDRLIWGNYIDDAHHINRPLSKMTQDILEQFGII